MKSKLTPLEALLTAVDLVDGQSAMSRLCGVTQGGVWRWINVAGQIPAEMVLRVEATTGVSRHDLRPDIYPPEQADPSRVWTALDRGTCRVAYERGCVPRDNNAAPLPEPPAQPIPKARPPGR